MENSVYFICFEQSHLTFCQWLLILAHFAAGFDFVHHSFLVISTQDGSGSCPTAAIYWPLLASTCSPFKAQPCWPDRYKLSLSARLREKKINVWEFTGLQMAIHGGSLTGMVKPAGHESRGNFISSCLLLQLGAKKSWWAFVYLSECYMVGTSLRPSKATFGSTHVAII